MAFVQHPQVLRCATGRGVGWGIPVDEGGRTTCKMCTWQRSTVDVIAEELSGGEERGRMEGSLNETKK